MDEFFVGITNDLYDMHSHSMASYLFYNYQATVSEEVYKIRQAIISDYQFALEKLQ